MHTRAWVVRGRASESAKSLIVCVCICRLHISDALQKKVNAYYSYLWLKQKSSVQGGFSLLHDNGNSPADTALVMSIKTHTNARAHKHTR